MAHQVFVSFNFKDVEKAKTVKGMFQPSNGPCQGRAVFVERDVTTNGPGALDRESRDAEITAEIRRVMAGCDCAVFVVGDDSHNSPWIDYEVRVADSNGWPLIATQLPDTAGGLPTTLARIHRVQVVPWSGAALGAALNKVGKTG